MEFIGDVRRRLFIERESEWNGIVREITANLERPGELVDASKVCVFIAEFFRTRAHWIRFQQTFSDPERWRKTTRGWMGARSQFDTED